VMNIETAKVRQMASVYPGIVLKNNGTSVK
jgi:hypothetical protein